MAKIYELTVLTR